MQGVVGRDVVQNSYEDLELRCGLGVWCGCWGRAVMWVCGVEAYLYGNRYMAVISMVTNSTCLHGNTCSEHNGIVRIIL